MLKDYKVTIGLEIHVALKTEKKLFSHTLNSFECEEFSLFDIGLPGVMPVLECEPVEMAIAFGLSVGAKIEKYSEFERKHYFYPDLPLGYQITQQHKPILSGGQVLLECGKAVLIEHAHLECDAAKSVHTGMGGYTEIDISRAASPLLEIVSMPCMHSPSEAKEYAKRIHELVCFLGICDGKMEEGSFRVDASISLSKTEKLGTRVEIKNISSFSFLEKALEFEMRRQLEVLESSGSITLETRLFDEKSMETLSMRGKETVAEYRYMVDPDIVPVYVSESLMQTVKEKYYVDYFSLLTQLKTKFYQDLDVDFTTILKDSTLLSLEMLSEKVISEKLSKLFLYWYPEMYKKTTGERKCVLGDLKIIEGAELEAKEAKVVLSQWLISGGDVKDYLPKFISSEVLSAIVEEEMLKWPSQVVKAKEGDEKVLQFLMGKSMSVLKGKAQATDIKKCIEIVLLKH